MSAMRSLMGAERKLAEQAENEAIDHSLDGASSSVGPSAVAIYAVIGGNARKQGVGR